MVSPPIIEHDIKTQMQIAVSLKVPHHHRPSYAPNAQAPERAKHACKAPGIEPRSSIHIRVVISLWMNVAWWIIVQLVCDRLSRFDRSPHAPLLLQLHTSLVHQVSHQNYATLQQSHAHCLAVLLQSCGIIVVASWHSMPLDKSCSALLAARSITLKRRYPCS